MGMIYHIHYDLSQN